MKNTVIPDHELVSRISRGSAPAHNCKNVRFVDHLYYAYACAELPRDLLNDFEAQSINLKALLSADCKVGLILIEANMYNLLFFLLHLFI